MRQLSPPCSVARSRGGFGTTATFVLVIIGIALMILLGGDLLGKGSRISIERAYVTGQLLRIARMAIDEAFESEKGRKQLTESLIKSVVDFQPVSGSTDNEKRHEAMTKLCQAVLVWDPNASPPGPMANGTLFAGRPRQDDMIEHVLTPKETSTDPAAVDGPKTGMHWWLKNGQVVFGVEDAKTFKYPLETLKAAYKEITKEGTGVLDLDEPVQVRAVSMHVLDYPGNGNKCAVGLVRGTVTVKWTLPRQVEGRSVTIRRTINVERGFELFAPNVDPGQPLGEWTMNFKTVEWRREAIGD